LQRAFPADPGATPRPADVIAPRLMMITRVGVTTLVLRAFLFIH